MEFTFQEILAGLIVAMAAIYAGRKTVKQFKPDDQKGGCDKCGCASGISNNHQKKQHITMPKHNQR